MVQRAVRLLACITILFASLASASAAPVLWDNGSPAYSNAWNFSNNIQDDFLFGTSHTVASIEAYIYDISGPVDFSNLFVKIDGANVSVLGRASSFAGVLGCCNANLYLVSLDIADTLVGAGAHQLQIGSSSGDLFHGWAWTGSVQLSPSIANGAVPGGYAPTDTAFRLLGVEDASVPEPGTVVLIALGLLAALLGRRRRE